MGKEEKKHMEHNALPTKYTFLEFKYIDKLTTYLNNQSIPVEMIVSISYDTDKKVWVLVYLKYNI